MTDSLELDRAARLARSRLIGELLAKVVRAALSLPGQALRILQDAPRVTSLERLYLCLQFRAPNAGSDNPCVDRKR